MPALRHRGWPRRALRVRGIGAVEPGPVAVGSILLSVFDSGLAPVANAEWLICPSGISGTANGSGQALIEDVPVGEVTIQTVDPGHTAKSTSVATVLEDTTIISDVTQNEAFSPLGC